MTGSQEDLAGVVVRLGLGAVAVAAMRVMTRWKLWADTAIQHLRSAENREA